MSKNTSKPNASTNRHNVRDSKGRFVSTGSRTVVMSQPNKGQIVSSVNVKSSFIQSMNIEKDLVNVVMSSNPKVVYTYQPTANVMKAIKKAISSNESLGVTFNKNLRGKNFEIYRTIYK
jgi:hypothetical protein